MSKTLLALRLSPDKASIHEFPTREAAESFLRDFQAKHGKVAYVLTVARTKRKLARPGQVQLRLAV